MASVGDEATQDGDPGSPRTRRAIAAALALVVVGYLALVLLGPLGKDRRLEPAELGLAVATVLVVAILLNPEMIDRVRNVKLPGLELELEQLKERQERQKDEIDDIRMVLTLLLQDHEIAHLRNLDRGRAGGYVGQGSVRAELRKLRDLRLIRTREGRRIGELVDGGRLDLGEVVELTPLGRRILDRLGDYRGDEIR